MYLTVKTQPHHLSKTDYATLRELCHIAKNLTNEAVYNIRQHYFQNGKFLKYETNYRQLKNSENYRLLNSNMAQQILKEVDGSFKSFFGLLKLARKGQYDFKACKISGYLPKDGFTTLVIGFVRIEGNKLVLPFSNTYRKTHTSVVLTLPPILHGKHIKEVRIIPKADARYFEIQYTYEAAEIQRHLDNNKALALDPGIDNFVTAISSEGDTFIIDGRRLKSMNQWYNKENARLQSMKDKQGISGYTNRQVRNVRKRNNRINDYISKAAKYLVEYCIQNNIGNLVLGYNSSFQNGSNMGKQNNQNFVQITFGKLKNELEYLCQLNGIHFVMQEESYTSKASFWDKDEIPVYDKNKSQEYKFSGKRIHRGMYRTKDGKFLNADVNGALNILRKSNVVSLRTLYTRGAVNTPVRIRCA